MWMVERNDCDSWEDADWGEENDAGNRVPMRFATKEAAEAEIDELIEDTKAAVAEGLMSEPYNREDYRAVPCNEGE